MGLFKRKEAAIWENSIKLIADTVDDVMGKTVDLYTRDDALQERASEEKLLDVSFECMLLLSHILDIMLFKKRPDVRDGIIKSVYNVILGAYTLSEIDPETPFSMDEFIDDRMQRYGMIAREGWQPAAYWWFGAELKNDPMIQCFALYGDYITYFRLYGELPLDDDIEPVILVDPLDCETLAVPFIIFQTLAPAVNMYIKQLDKIIR